MKPAAKINIMCLYGQNGKSPCDGFGNTRWLMWEYRHMGIRNTHPHTVCACPLLNYRTHWIIIASFICGWIFRWNHSRTFSMYIYLIKYKYWQERSGSPKSPSVPRLDSSRRGGEREGLGEFCPLANILKAIGIIYDHHSRRPVLSEVQMLCGGGWQSNGCV